MTGTRSSRGRDHADAGSPVGALLRSIITGEVERVPNVVPNEILSAIAERGAPGGALTDRSLLERS